MASRRRVRFGLPARQRESRAWPRARRSSSAPSPLRASCRTRRREAGRRAESRPLYGVPGASRTRNGQRLIHALSRSPAAFQDVADLAHAPDIGVADALPVGTAVAVAQETIAGQAQE